MRELKIVFEGNNISRKDFLQNFTNSTIVFVGEKHTGFVMLLREILKNIYDHADGLGQITLVNDNDSICFDIFDFGTESFNLMQIKAGTSTKSGNGINFGSGIIGGMIEDYASALKIELEIDTSNGFRYKGIYKMHD